MDSLKGNWGNRNNADFLYQIAFDFVAQLEDIMRAERIDRTELATKLKVSKGRVSQVFNDPGRLRLETIVQYTRALKRKVALVAYDDDDPANKNGPIPPGVFVISWEKAGRPADFFAVEMPIAESIPIKTGLGFEWNKFNGPTLATLHEGEKAGTPAGSDEDDDEEYKPTLKDLDYAGTDPTRF